MCIGPLRSTGSLTRCHRETMLRFASCAFALVLISCLVREKCYVDGDCERPRICGVNGECQFQCAADSDCDTEAGATRICLANRCIEPVECTVCAFAHADSSCIHGVCRMGPCSDGYLDLNGESGDGCEYECRTTGEEICDGTDNDCNGLVDETTDLLSDSLNCGQCGHGCPSPPQADAVCSSGRCTYACVAGYYDNNGRAEDGCEGLACTPTAEICDGRDNDCDCSGDSNDDGLVCGPGDDGVDEGFDKTLATSCGPYCTHCSYPHATAECAAGACRLAQCDSGWHDSDGIADTGCEYRCAVTGEELCDTLDNDCDGEVDEGGVCQTRCPPDMVAIGTAYCVDRYEASRADSSAEDAGQDNTIALSRPGVMPWMVNPMTPSRLAEFQAACATAGKHLCSREEWFAACTGPSQTTYVYGNVFERETCNCVDTYCDDYCAEHGIEANQCSTGPDCGYRYDCYRVVRTAQFADCTNDYGTLDMNGNLWEVVTSDVDSRGYELRGGAFNCAGASQRVNCSFNASWSELYAGFRCCKSSAN